MCAEVFSAIAYATAFAHAARAENPLRVMKKSMSDRGTAPSPSWDGAALGSRRRFKPTPRCRQAAFQRLEKRHRTKRFLQAASSTQGLGGAEKVRQGRAGIAEHESGNRHDRDAGRTSIKGLNGLEAIHAGHDNIDDGGIDGRLCGGFDGTAPVLNDDDLETRVLEQHLDRGTDSLVIVDDQDAWHEALNRHPWEPGMSNTFESPYNVKYTNFTPQSKELGRNLLGIAEQDQ